MKRMIKQEFRNFCEVTGFTGETKELVISSVALVAFFLLLGFAELVAQWLEN